MSRKRFLVWVPLVLMGLAASEGAFAAPQQLLNKAIQFSWSTEVVQRGPDGQIVRPRIDTNKTVYVSSAGRLFERSSRENRKRRLNKGGDYAPDTATNKSGEARGLRFAGNSLVGSHAWAQGAATRTSSWVSAGMRLIGPCRDHCLTV